MNRVYFALATFVFGFFLFSSPVFAQTDCQPIFGGGQTCGQNGEITLDKTVQRPDSTAFVNNLGTNDPHFTPGQTITFRITVKNNGNQPTQNMVARDIFPQYVTFAEGPGTFDAKTRTLTLTVEPLKANEARTYTLRGKVVAVNQLPQKERVVCVTNQASVINNNRTSSDNTQFCIERPQESAPATTKGGKPIFPPASTNQTPKTGPAAVGLISLVSSGMLGFWLRKRTKKL